MTNRRTRRSAPRPVDLIGAGLLCGLLGLWMAAIAMCAGALVGATLGLMVLHGALRAARRLSGALRPSRIASAS